MTRAVLLALSAIATGVLGATLAPSDFQDLAPHILGDEYVFEADFHIHCFPGDGVLSPMATVMQAESRGLDVVAITNHNQVVAARIAKWYPDLVGGPMVLVGQEVTSPTWHLIAIGLREWVDWRLPLSEAIEAIHAQGGLAIAAHPVAKFHPEFSDLGKLGLDGTEVMHGLVFHNTSESQELQAFYEWAEPHGVAAIGSSDHHFLDTLGSVRTFVFARQPTANGVLEAIRRGHTVVFDLDERSFGDSRRAEILRPFLRGQSIERSYARVGFSILGLAGIAFLVLRSDLWRDDALRPNRPAGVAGLTAGG